MSNIKSYIEPIKLDIKNERIKRQYKNVDDVLDCLKNDLSFCGNMKAFKRLLEYSGITEEECRQKCKVDKIYAKSVAIISGKNSSRQGSLDETR